MLYDFRLQYDAALIPELAAKYLRTPYEDRTAADWAPQFASIFEKLTA